MYWLLNGKIVIENERFYSKIIFYNVTLCLSKINNFPSNNISVVRFETPEIFGTFVWRNVNTHDLSAE